MKLSDLKGFKTYIVTIGTICYALGGAVAGFHDWGFAIPLILGALGLSALRHGMPEEVVKIQAPA